MKSLKFYTACFYCMPSWGVPKYTKPNYTDQVLLAHIKLFQKNKKRSGTSFAALFSARFLKKIWVVLIHNTQSNNSWSNDAQFMHKLYLSLPAYKQIGRGGIHHIMLKSWNILLSNSNQAWFFSLKTIII